MKPHHNICIGSLFLALAVACPQPPSKPTRIAIVSLEIIQRRAEEKFDHFCPEPIKTDGGDIVNFPDGGSVEFCDALAKCASDLNTAAQECKPADMTPSSCGSKDQKARETCKQVGVE